MLVLLLACNVGDDDYPRPDLGGDTGGSEVAGPLTVAASAPTTAVDECGQACVTVTVRQGAEPLGGAIVDVWVGETNVAADLRTRGDGTAEACAAGLDVGTHEVIVTVEAGAEQASAATQIDVRPFGWAAGIVRSETVVTELPWTPSFHKAEVVLLPGAGSAWDADGPTFASVAAHEGGYALVYAGAASAEATATSLGAATSPDGLTWTKSAANPIVEADGAAGSWKRTSVGAPMLLEETGTVNLYFSGRADETGNVTLGLAQGADLSELAEVAQNPVFSWDKEDMSWGGQTVTHPSIVRDASGFFELWYAGGTDKIGYAYSADGLAWSRYCKNPVFEGDLAAAWEHNRTGSPEVVKRGDWYMMAYTAGDPESSSVGWAMSRDGLRWVRAAAPILEPSGLPGTWNESAVAAPSLQVVGNELWAFPTGRSLSGSAIGWTSTSLETAP